jgi:hypothetical protein
MKVLKNSNPGAPTNITSTITTIPGFSNSNNNIIIYTSAASSNMISFRGGTTEFARFTGDGFFNIYGLTNVYSNILPASNFVYDLGSSNMRFRSIYLASNSIDMGGTLISVANGVVRVADSNNSNASLVVNQIQIGTQSNAVRLSLDTSNNIQFQSLTLSNGVPTSTSYAVVAGGWSNNGTNVYLLGSNVGIGASNPGSRLAVAGNVSIGANYSNVAAPANGLLVSGSVAIGTSNVDPSYKLDVSGNIRATANVVSYSDSNVKKDFQVITNALDKLKIVNGYTYKRRDEDTGRRYAGVIAQEVENVLPEVVFDDAEGKKSVAYGNIVALLIEAVKDLNARLDAAGI